MDFKNIAKWKIYVGIWALLLIPFFVANLMFFPYISGKNFAFRIIIEIIFAVWVYLAFADIKYRPKFSWTLVSVGIFTLVMLLADIFAIAPMKALWSNFERMDGWVTLIHLFMLTVVLGNTLKAEKLWLNLFRTSLALSVVMDILVLKEWLTTGSGRVSVTLGNTIYVAVYFLFNLFFALILWYKDVIVKIEDKNNLKLIFKNRLTYVYLVGVFLCAWGIWRTATRGVILGLLGGLLVSAILIAIFEKKNKIIRRSAFGGIILIFVLVFGFLFIKNTEFVKNNIVLSRFASISWNSINGQGQARQYVWPMAIKGFVEKPILGWGQDGFNYVFNKYYDPRMYGQEQWFDRAHNMPLDILVAGGALGLLSYLSIFVALIFVVWKRREKLGVIDGALLVGLLAGYFFQNLFVFDNLISYLFFFIVISYIYSRDVEDKISDKKDEDNLSEENLNYVVLPILAVTLLVSLWYVNIRPINANLDLIKGIQSYPGGLSQNLEYFKKALSYNTFAGPEIREQLLSITPKISSMNVDQKTKQDFIDLTLSEIDRQVKQTPNDARYQLFAGVFLKNIGQYELARGYLEKAVELSPNKQTMNFELITLLSILGEKDKALELSKKVYELDKNFSSAKDYYISSLIINNKMDEVRDLMGEATTSSEVIVRAFLIRASDYMTKGDKYSAIYEINRAIKIAPIFKEQGETMIKSVLDGTIK
jgi:O-antigen ligase